jgi:hypothetical protein
MAAENLERTPPSLTAGMRQGMPALHRYIDIEATLAATAKRNVKLRMAIGLPPIPRRINRGCRQ